MASKFWIGGTGTWDNTNNTNWSTSSGGANNTTHPTSGDTVTLDAASGGGTVTLGADISISSITGGAFTGILNFSTYNPTMVTFNFSGTGVRTLNMGSGTWTLTGSGATIWNTGTATNLTMNTGTSTIIANYSGSTGTRTFNDGTGASTFNNISITAGSDIVIHTTNGPTIKNLDFTGFTGSISATNSINVFGNLTFGVGMTVPDGSGGFNINGISGTQTLTTNGVLLNQINKTGVGGTLQLADNLTLNPTRSLSLTSGNIDANNKAVTCGSFASSNSNTRTLTKGTGLWTLTGTGTVWNTATTTGLTFTDGGTTKITDSATAAGCTFSGGGLTYNNVWFSRGTNAQSNTIVGDNTFRTLRDDGSVAHSILFTTGSTQRIGTFGISGTAGQLITINSTDTGVHNLVATAGGISRDYLNIQHSVATPSNYWYAGTHSVNNQGVATTGSGWTFTDIPSGYGVTNKTSNTNSIGIVI